MELIFVKRYFANYLIKCVECGNEFLTDYESFNREEKENTKDVRVPAISQNCVVAQGCSD